jgi:tetratricopeptide (TPR) repeat protein
MESKLLTKSPGLKAPSGSAVSVRCEIARDLQSRGEYEAASEALGEFWRGIGNRPALDGLSAAEQADVIGRVGAVAGCLGSSAQVQGAQEFAKDLISESLRAFQALGDQDKIAEAQNDLAICYWREGAMDEGRVWFHEALESAKSPALKFRILVNSTMVEHGSNRYYASLSLLEQAAKLRDLVDDPGLIGRFHMQKALAYRNLGGPENIDRALIENAAAGIHLEQANNKRFLARVENNTGIIFRELGRYAEAIEHLDRARAVFTEIGDVGTAAQVNETRARVFLAQGRYVEAEKIAFSSASTFEGGGEYSLLAEALEAQGIALARMGRYQSALGILKRAAHVAETAGHSQLSGKILLTILEEVKNFLSPSEVGSMYHEADLKLGDQITPELSARLRSCARLATANSATVRGENSTAGSFEQEVHKRESELIRSALETAGGSVTRAARLLGLTHQGLCYIINHRHKALLSARAPIRVRRKSIIKKGLKKKR